MNLIILPVPFTVEAPAGEDRFQVNVRPIPNVKGLWGLMEEASVHRRAERNSQGNTDWYYQAGSLLCIFMILNFLRKWGLLRGFMYGGIMLA